VQTIVYMLHGSRHATTISTTASVAIDSRPALQDDMDMTTKTLELVRFFYPHNTDSNGCDSIT